MKRRGKVSRKGGAMNAGFWRINRSSTGARLKTKRCRVGCLQGSEVSEFGLLWRGVRGEEARAKSSMAHTVQHCSENPSKLVHGSWLLDCGDLDRCNFVFHIFNKGILMTSVVFWADKRPSPMYKTESLKTSPPSVLNLELKGGFRTKARWEQVS